MYFTDQACILRSVTLDSHNLKLHINAFFFMCEKECTVFKTCERMDVHWKVELRQLIKSWVCVCVSVWRQQDVQRTMTNSKRDFQVWWMHEWLVIITTPWQQREESLIIISSNLWLIFDRNNSGLKGKHLQKNAAQRNYLQYICMDLHEFAWLRLDGL